LRFIGVIALAFVATVASFFATMIALDHELFGTMGHVDTRRAPATTRLAAFAAPELAASTDLLTMLRPHPALADLDGRPSRKDATAMLPDRMTLASSQITDVASAIRNQLVPPMARRAPVEPMLVPDEPTLTAKATPSPRPHRPTAFAQEVPQAKPVRRTPPQFDTATRSALGGPKPSLVAAPKPAAR